MSHKNIPRPFTIYDSSRDEPTIFRADSIASSYSKRLKKRTSSQSSDNKLEKSELFGQWAKIEQPFFICEKDSDKNICHRFLESATQKNGKGKSTKELPFVLKNVMNKPKEVEQPPKKKTLAGCIKDIKKIFIEFQQIIVSFTEQIRHIFSSSIFSIENKAEGINKAMNRLLEELELSSESLQLKTENKKLNSLCFEQNKNTFSSQKNFELPFNQNRSMEIASTNSSRLAERLPQTERKLLKTSKLHELMGGKTSEMCGVNFNVFNSVLLKMKRISFEGAIVKG